MHSLLSGFLNTYWTPLVPQGLSASGKPPGFAFLPPPGACSGNPSTSLHWGNLFVLFPYPSDHRALFPDVWWHGQHFFHMVCQVFGCCKWKAKSDPYDSTLRELVSPSAFVSAPCRSLCDLSAFPTYVIGGRPLGVSLSCRYHREKLPSAPKKSHHCAAWRTFPMGLQGERSGGPPVPAGGDLAE